MWYLFFSICFISLNTISSSGHYFDENDTISFLNSCIILSVHTHHIFFICFSDNRHFGQLRILAIVMNTAVDVVVHRSPWYNISYQLNTYRSGIAGAYDKLHLFFLRHVHAVFHSDFTKWHSHQQMFHFVHILTRIYHSLSLGCQPFWQEWGYIYIYITVVLMAKDVEKFFHVFLCHLYFFIRVLPFDIICHVLTRLLAFLLWNWVADMFY